MSFLFPLGVSVRSPSILGRVVAVLGAVAACLFAPLLPSDARACRFAGPLDHEIVADPADTTPPAAPSAVVRDLQRGTSGGCWGGSSSCDDIASISLDVDSTDETSPREQIGFVITVVDGELPEHAGPLNRPVRPLASAGYVVHWIETSAPPFFARLSISAVDRAGNVSEPTFVEVSDGTFDGCGVAPGMRRALGLAPAGIAVLLLALAARTGRPRRAA